jgi:hypothetical protein
MNSEDAQAVSFVIVLIVILAITFVPFALFIGYVLFQKQKRDRIRTTILRDGQQCRFLVLLRYSKRETLFQLGNGIACLRLAQIDQSNLR